MIYIIRPSKFHRNRNCHAYTTYETHKLENDFSRTIKPVIIHVAIVSDNFRFMCLLKI